MFEEESGAMVGEKTHNLQRVKAGRTIKRITERRATVS
jgi:hypothetical protein